MENYEQKYKEALERAKEYNIDGLTLHVKEVIEHIFPEFKKSKDDMIREALLELVKQSSHILNPMKQKSMIAWLKKQGKKSDNTVKSKFKAGDWVVRNYPDSTKEVDRIINVKWLDDETYGYDLNDGTYFSGSFEKEYHLWTIQDAEKGDILCYKDEIFIFKHFVTFSTVVYYCCYDNRNFILNSVYSLSKEEFNKIHPATREQHDLLFQKMKEAGYKWNIDEKELKLL